MGTMRTAVGGWVVTTVLGGLLVGTAVLGPGEPGTAARQPPPSPPAVGSCLSDLTYLKPVFVSCDQPHVGEVTLAWTGRLPPGPSPAVEVPEEPQSHCTQAVTDYVGGRSRAQVSWVVPGLGTATSLVRTPGQAYVPDWSWTACVVSPTSDDGSAPAPLLGSLHDVLDGPRDPRWLLCGADLSFDTPCTAAHRQELVAVATVEISPMECQLYDSAAPGTVQPHDAVLEAECVRLVDHYLGGPGDVHDGVLAAVLTFYFAFPTSQNLGPQATFGCAVEVLGERDLTASVTGIGTGPVPLG